jgi:hypothetical protein
MTRTPIERTLYTHINAAVQIASELASLSYNDEIINEISDLPGFPVSPENSNINIRTDNYVLITDQMNEAMNHLIQARKCLLLLGVQGLVFSEAPPYEKKVPSDPENVRFEL